MTMGMEPWRVAIVNEEFARRFGLGRDVVGKQMFESGQAVTIVGMVGNVRTRGLRTTPFPEVYLSSLRFSWTNQYLVVRSAIPPAQLVKLVKAAIQSSNSDQAVFGVMTMDELIADSVTEPRFHAFLIGAFALLALSMSASGMYSVISFLVSQRIGEIATRIALGASSSNICQNGSGDHQCWGVGRADIGYRPVSGREQDHAFRHECGGQRVAGDVRRSSALLCGGDAIGNLPGPCAASAAWIRRPLYAVSKSAPLAHRSRFRVAMRSFCSACMKFRTWPVLAR